MPEEYSPEDFLTVKQIRHPVLKLKVPTVSTRNRYSGLQEEEQGLPSAATQLHHRYRKTGHKLRRKDHRLSDNGIRAGADGRVSSGASATGFSNDLSARSIDNIIL